MNRRSFNALFLKIELILTVLFIIYFAQAFYSLPFLDTAFTALSYLLIPILILKNWKRYAYFLTQDVFILILIFLAFFSCLWSTDALTTLANARGMARMSIFGFYFATRYRLQDQVRILAFSLSLAGIWTLLVSILVPSIGITPIGLKGSFPQKNDLGRVMVLSFITHSNFIISKSKSNISHWFGSILALLLILLSRSKTALVVTFVLMLFWPLSNSLRQGYRWKTVLLILSLLLGVGAATWVSLNYEFLIVDVLGKDLTLSGRTDLWSVLLERFAERPWFGYGYNAFWSTEFRWVQEHKRYGFSWTPTHAHSGFLDVALSLGVTGLILFLLSFARVYLKSVKVVGITKAPEFIWTLQFLTLVFAYNLSITQSILSPENIIWALYISVAVTMATPLKNLCQVKGNNLEERA